MLSRVKIDISKNSIHQALLVFLFVMLAYGYIIGVSIPLFLNVATRPFNVFFRFIYLLIAIYLIADALNGISWRRYTIIVYTLLFFIGIYIVRIIYDIFIEGIVFKNSIFLTLTASIGSSFLPFVALALHAKKIDAKKILKVSYWAILLSCFLIIYLVILQYGGVSLDIFIGRVNIISEENDKGAINPITLSFYGASLSLLSFYFLFIYRKFSQILLFITFIFGFLILVMGASRGPQVNYFICLFFLIFYLVFLKRKSLFLKTQIFGFGMIIFSIIIYAISKIDLESVSMYRRFSGFGESAESDTSLREQSWQRAITDFLDYPILGKSYLDTFNMSYPHNIYLEALMALGVFGFIFFIIPIVMLCIQKIRNEIQAGIYLVFLMALIGGLFSGSLFINPFLWCALGLMISFKYHRKLA